MAIAGLARNLGIMTTAEGVETKQQLQQIKALGCTEMQGFLFSPPRRVEEIVELLRSRPERKTMGPQARRSAKLASIPAATARSAQRLSVCRINIPDRVIYYPFSAALAGGQLEDPAHRRCLPPPAAIRLP
jgi:hypothetical protein